MKDGRKEDFRFGGRMIYIICGHEMDVKKKIWKKGRNGRKEEMKKGRKEKRGKRENMIGCGLNAKNNAKKKNIIRDLDMYFR